MSQLIAINHRAYLIKHTHDPCEEVQWEAVKRNQDLIGYINDPSYELIQYVMEKIISLHTYVITGGRGKEDADHQSCWEGDEDFWMKHMHENPLRIRFCKGPSEIMQVLLGSSTTPQKK